MMRKFLTAVLLFLLCCTEVFSEIPFESSYKKDGIIFGTGTLLFGTGIAMNRLNSNVMTEIPEIKNINPIDRWSVRDINKKIAIASNVTYALDVMIFPETLFAGEFFCNKISGEELYTIGIMYAESYLFTKGTVNVIKNIVNRPRPYSYFDGTDPFNTSVKDRTRSFPSGHTADVFMSAAFTTYVYAESFPESDWKYAVAGASFSLAAVTGAFRIFCGNHFLLDVGAGAFIGTVCGFGIPYLHKKGTSSEKPVTDPSENLRSTHAGVPQGGGINFRITF